MPFPSLTGSPCTQGARAPPGQRAERQPRLHWEDLGAVHEEAEESGLSGSSPASSCSSVHHAAGPAVSTVPCPGCSFPLLRSSLAEKCWPGASSLRALLLPVSWPPGQGQSGWQHPLPHRHPRIQQEAAPALSQPCQLRRVPGL